MRKHGKGGGGGAIGLHICSPYCKVSYTLAACLHGATVSLHVGHDMALLMMLMLAVYFLKTSWLHAMFMTLSHALVPDAVAETMLKNKYILRKTG